MSVSVLATGSLHTHVPNGTVLHDVATVGEAIECLDLPADIGLAMLVNGRIAHWGTALQDGDTLQLIPQLSGGGRLLSPEEA